MTPTTPRLVLLHAFPLNRHMWAPQLELMPGATIAPDLYELGESIESWAIATLDTLGPGPLIVVGASMGGSCALEMARLAGDRIEALVLVGAKAGYRPEPKLRDAYIESLETEGLMGLWPDLQTLAFGAASDERFVSRVREMALEQRTEDPGVCGPSLPRSCRLVTGRAELDKTPPGSFRRPRNAPTTREGGRSRR